MSLPWESRGLNFANVQFSYELNRFYKNANFSPSELDSGVCEP